MPAIQRSFDRSTREARPITIEPGYLKHAEGSALIAFGDTKVLCTASVEAGVPGWLRGSGQGWLTAEYGMLPRATNTRNEREAARGKQGGRTMEIQRLIGRSLRACIDVKLLGEQTITLDCDVIQADGGTRTAAVTQPCPLPRSQPGTPASTLAVQSTFVSPKAISAEPSACFR